MFLKFFPKYVLKIFLNIVKKTPVLESPFNKVAGLKVCIFVQKENPAQLFSCEYCEILKKLFYRTSDDFGNKIDVFHTPCVIALFPS